MDELISGRLSGCRDYSMKVVFPSDLWTLVSPPHVDKPYERGSMLWRDAHVAHGHESVISCDKQSGALKGNTTRKKSIVERHEPWGAIPLQLDINQWHIYIYTSKKNPTKSKTFTFGTKHFLWDMVVYLESSPNMFFLLCRWTFFGSF